MTCKPGGEIPSAFEIRLNLPERFDQYSIPGGANQAPHRLIDRNSRAHQCVHLAREQYQVFELRRFGCQKPANFLEDVTIARSINLLSDIDRRYTDVHELPGHGVRSGRLQHAFDKAPA